MLGDAKAYMDTSHQLFYATKKFSYANPTESYITLSRHWLLVIDHNTAFYCFTSRQQVASASNSTDSYYHPKPGCVQVKILSVLEPLIRNDPRNQTSWNQIHSKTVWDYQIVQLEILIEELAALENVQISLRKCYQYLVDWLSKSKIMNQGPEIY